MTTGQVTAAELLLQHRNRDEVALTISKIGLSPTGSGSTNRCGEPPCGKEFAIRSSPLISGCCSTTLPTTSSGWARPLSQER